MSVVRLIETESGMVVAGRWGEELGELLLNEYSFFGEGEKVLEMNSNDGCTAV